jgi:hypothetical protein
MEVKPAQPRASSNRCQVRLVGMMFIEVADDAGNAFKVSHVVIMQ